MSSMTTVVVRILDVNDNPPEFERTLYSLSANEASPIGTSVGRVFATSRDVGVNAQITYSVVSSVGNDFSIDPESGTRTCRFLSFHQ